MVRTKKKKKTVMQSVAGSGLGWEGLESTGEELRLELRTQAL